MLLFQKWLEIWSVILFFMRIRKLKVIVAGGLFCVHFFSVPLETFLLVAKKGGWQRAVSSCFSRKIMVYPFYNSKKKICDFYLISFSVLVKKRFGNRNCLFETEERSKEATNTAPWLSQFIRREPAWQRWVPRCILKERHRTRGCFWWQHCSGNCAGLSAGTGGDWGRVEVHTESGSSD